LIGSGTRLAPLGSGELDAACLASSNAHGGWALANRLPDAEEAFNERR
jgi:hypothetical protein